MVRISQVVLCVVFASSFGAPSYAACSLAGKWHAVTIATGNHTVSGSGTLASGCRLTIKANGSVTGTCLRQQIGESTTTSTNLSGTLKTNANCEISGVWKISGYADANVIAGFVSGDSAAFSAARGNPAYQVRSVTLIRD